MTREYFTARHDAGHSYVTGLQRPGLDPSNWFVQGVTPAGRPVADARRAAGGLNL
jgi:hypothetical protein